MYSSCTIRLQFESHCRSLLESCGVINEGLKIFSYCLKDRMQGVRLECQISSPIVRAYYDDVFFIYKYKKYFLNICFDSLF